MRGVRCSVTLTLIFLSAIFSGRLWPSAQAGGLDDSAGKPVALKGLDPVLLTEGKQVKGQAGLSVTRDDFRYLFVDATSKARFDKDPKRYEIQFHGKCAMMPEAPAQPDLFTVYKGRIYAFGSEACQESFRDEP